MTEKRLTQFLKEFEETFNESEFLELYLQKYFPTLNFYQNYQKLCNKFRDISIRLFFNECTSPITIASINNFDVSSGTIFVQYSLQGEKYLKQKIAEVEGGVFTNFYTSLITRQAMELPFNSML